MGDQFFVDGADLSGDTATLGNIGSPQGVLQVPGINATGMERIYSHHDGIMEFTTYFNDAAGQEHLTLRGKGDGSDRIASYFRGATIGNISAHLVAKQINYDPNRGADGSLISTTQCLGNLYGLDWGRMLTAGKRTDTTATNGTSLDNLAASATGFAAYCHVTSVTGTSVTVKIQESSNDGAGDAFADIITFTAVLGAATGFQRSALATLTTAVERYLRVVTTGTFSEAKFAVGATRTPYAL
jgi:hypothetical protein